MEVALGRIAPARQRPRRYYRPIRLRPSHYGDMSQTRFGSQIPDLAADQKAKIGKYLPTTITFEHSDWIKAPRNVNERSSDSSSNLFVLCKEPEINTFLKWVRHGPGYGCQWTTPPCLSLTNTVFDSFVLHVSYELDEGAFHITGAWDQDHPGSYSPARVPGNKGSS